MRATSRIMLACPRGGNGANRPRLPVLPGNVVCPPFPLALAQVAVEGLLPFGAADLCQQRRVQRLARRKSRFQSERVVLALDNLQQYLDARRSIFERPAQQRLIVDQRRLLPVPSVLLTGPSIDLIAETNMLHSAVKIISINQPDS
jgi:hypothetical protein